jgi:predicted transcriptional regulator
MKKSLLISVKEEYTNKILSGEKTIELRKCIPNVSPGDEVLIYCTAPIKAIVGRATVKNVIVHSPNQMWKLHSSKLGISKLAFIDYYNNHKKAIGIVLTDVKKMQKNIELNQLRNRLPNFSPPQTYKYFLNFRFFN